MQQKAPLVPKDLNNQQEPQHQKPNFFKATLSSRRKAVPTAVKSEVPTKTKIGSAETKPVTRNRPRPTSLEQEVPANKLNKAKPNERPKGINLKHIDHKRRNPERPTRTKAINDPKKPLEEKKQDQKIVPQPVKASATTFIQPIPKSPKKLSASKPELSNVKSTKNINNNDWWTNANVAKVEFVLGGPSQGKQESTLKGAPSVSSLDSKHHKVAPSRDKTLKIFGSKEKLHKPKKRDLGNNNAVLEDPEYVGGSEEYVGGSVEELEVGVEGAGSQEYVSLPVTLNAELMPEFQEVELRQRMPSEISLASGAREMEILRRELDATTMERAQLQARIEELVERAAEAEKLREELKRMKAVESDRISTLERLSDENGALRARLRGVAHSPLSDSEKRQLLLAPAPRRMHSSAPASIALPHNGEGDNGETPCPEWDKSSSLSEVSVACLQDRILQMEEHHYSTNEELQATLAELSDLQTQLADAHAANDRLEDEKRFLLESFCMQTEKLEDSRTKVDTLQELFRTEGIDPESLTCGDTDNLFAVLKMTKEDRRLVVGRQQELEADLSRTTALLEDNTKHIEKLNEQIRLSESTAERLECAKEEAEREARERGILADSLAERLDSAKAKLAERAGEAEGAVEAAAGARREAAEHAARVSALQERLDNAQRQLDRAHQQARKLRDDSVVSRNNAKSTISDLEFQIEQLRQDKTALQTEVKTLQDTVTDLQLQVQAMSDEKLSLMSRTTDSMSRVAELERHLQEARGKHAQLLRDRERDESEWKQFQSDLLMTVRVANDFKTEAQRELERLVTDNKAARDRIRHLEDQVHSLKTIPPRSEESTPPLLTSASLQDIMATAAEHRRSKGVSRQDSRLSVKSLIETIENAAKVAKHHSPTATPTEWPQVQNPVVTSTNQSAIKNGVAVDGNTNGHNTTTTFNNKPPAARSNRSSPIASSEAATNLPDEQRHALATLQQKAIESFVRRNSYGDICERKDPLNALQVKNGGSKRNALLKWCQQKTQGYNNIDITNFSSSWNDGMALCAILHSYLGEARVPYAGLTPADKRTNFTRAFQAAEAVGIPTTLNIQDMIQQERPDWQQVMAYVTNIYKHFET